MTHRVTNQSGCPSRKRSVLPTVLSLFLTLIALGSCPGLEARARAASPSAEKAHADATRSQLAMKYSQIPLSFEENQGQADAQIKYLSRSEGYSVFLTPNAAVLAVRGGNSQTPAMLKMELVGANAATQLRSLKKLPGVSNYLIGKDPTQWHTNVPTFEKVQYHAVYPGIDAVFYGNQRQLEYDFVVAPGADANKIALSISGASPQMNAGGDITLTAAGREIVLQKPVVFQGTGSKRKVVSANYEVAGNNIRFRLGDYDHTLPLTIDPTFVYVTYLGGTVNSVIGAFAPQYGGITPSTFVLSNALAIDSAGNAYVTGETESADFPTLGGYQNTRTDQTGNNFAVFVTKLNPTGTGLVYSTYLGGTNSDSGIAIAVDSAGSAYVVGYSNSLDYPTTAGAYQTTFNNSYQQAFVTKLNAAGNGLVYSTLLGGVEYNEAYAIAVDAQGQAYVAGNIGGGGIGGSLDFPQTSDALPAPTNEFASRAFVSVLNAAGSGLLYSTQIADVQGGNNQTTAQGVAVDPSGNFYVTGSTQSPSLPVTAGAFQTTLGTNNATPTVTFAAKFGPATPGATPLTYLTYLRATGVDYGDWGGAVTADSAGNAYVAGYTASPTYPTTSGAYQTSCVPNGADSCFTAFVTKLNPAGTAPVWSTLLGNSVNEYVSSVELDTLGNIYVAGGAGFSTEPGYFPTVNPVQNITAGGGKAFIAELDPTGSNLLFSSPVGDPTSTSFGTGLAVDSLGAIYLGGVTTQGSGLPTTPGAFQGTYPGGEDTGFVAKINPATPNLTIAVSHSGSFTQGQSGAAYTIGVTNAGTASTNGTVTVTEAVPTGLTLVSMAGTGWTCTALPTCTRSDALAAAAAYPPIAATVNVATNAASTLVNTATVSGGGEFNTSNDSASDSTIVAVTVAPAAPTLTVTPATTSTTTGSTLSVVAKVTGGGPSPTGTVTLMAGTYTSAAATLSSSSSYTFTIPSDSLPVGSDTITVTYSGDSNYVTAKSTATVTVSESLYTLAATSPAAVTRGTPATSTVTVATTTGYVGTVSLTCTLTSFPAGATNMPTCTVANSGIALTASASTATASVTVDSTAATTAKLADPTGLQNPGRGWPASTTGGAVLACLVLVISPRHRRRWQSLLIAVLAVGAIGVLSGCGGHSGSSGTANAGTSPGSYSFTVTGTGTPAVSPTPSTTFNLTIN